MRIIKGSDYYDSALAYGADRETVFVRDGLTYENKDFEAKYGVLVPAYAGFNVAPNEKRSRWGIGGRLRWSDNEFVLRREGVNYRVTYDAVTVFVAGQRYHGLEVNETTDSRFPPIRHMFWDAETFVHYVDSLDHHIDTTSFVPWGRRDEDRSVEKFFNPTTTDADFDFLVNHRISVLTFGPPGPMRRGGNADRWVVNGDNLGHYGFAKRIDPYQCFQELSMWVGGIIPKDGPPMVEITDDKVKAHKAGFDTKWSFRRTNEHKPNS